MNKAHIRYFEQEDVLHLVITDEPESRSIELSPNITVELILQRKITLLRKIEQLLTAHNGSKRGRDLS